jgi:hypothetical protein
MNDAERFATVVSSISGKRLNTLGTWLAAADFNHDGKLDIAFQTPQNPGGSQPAVIKLVP